MLVCASFSRYPLLLVLPHPRLGWFFGPQGAERHPGVPPGGRPRFMAPRIISLLSFLPTDSYDGDDRIFRPPAYQYMPDRLLNILSHGQFGLIFFFFLTETAFFFLLYYHGYSPTGLGPNGLINFCVFCIDPFNPPYT